MHLLLQITVVFLACISHQHKAVAEYKLPYTSFVFPITKHIDAAKPLYSIKLVTEYDSSSSIWHVNFLIDIDAPFTWHECFLVWNTFAHDSCPSNTLCRSPISSDEFECTEVRTSYSYVSPSCPPITNSSTLPGWGFSTCTVNAMNPANGECTQPELNGDSFSTNASDGRNPFLVKQDIFNYAACAPSSSFESFPANVSGVMAFSTSAYALLASFTYSLLKRNLVLCLPSNLTARGVLFFGSGPFYLLPHSNDDLRSFLSYTPLLKHPDSFSYFIGVNAIVIKQRYIEVVGSTTARLSTNEPYTTLKSDIYNRMVQRFSKVTKRIPRAKPVAPFGLCYRTFTNGTRVGLKVPDIDLSLPDGKKWTISTANSIKQVTEDVACLAFVDGGSTSEPSIVIGTFQMEDNFLLFDIENSTFGFSSSLLKKGTSCANFNFTNGNLDPYPW